MRNDVNDGRKHNSLPLGPIVQPSSPTTKELMAHSKAHPYSLALVQILVTGNILPSLPMNGQTEQKNKAKK